MKKNIIIYAMIIAFPFISVAHEHDHHQHEDMKMGKPAIATSLYQLDSEWTDQDGKKIKIQDLAGQPRLISMLYTRCLTACPLLVDEIQRILNQLPKDQKEMPVTVFSFDSEYETPETMKEFIKKRKLGVNWKPLKGNADAVAELAAALGVRYKKLKNSEYIHSNVIFLLDEKGNIVAQKEGLNTSSTDFEKEIRKLKSAPKKK